MSEKWISIGTPPCAQEPLSKATRRTLHGLAADVYVKAIEDAGMVFAPRLAALHRALGTRRAVVAGLAAFLALLASLPGRTAFVPASRALDVPQQ